MSHPRYADGDPKAGQPVLVGDCISAYGTACGDVPLIRATVTDINEHVVKTIDAGGVSSVPVTYRFFSQPPAPAIEPCVCGGSAAVYTRAVSECDVMYHVACGKCRRRGQESADHGLAVGHWTVDMSAIKFFRKQQESNCPQCKGSGYLRAEDGTVMSACSLCHGSGTK